ncbi:hypothetical protein ACSHT0_09425 [Tepidicaulis sp. LMO-SS28]|uniref:hypothetical protein n=1 Tax=Tepidicaulis sp. LMO-SS28 TaxID=3447455 RepID=UPI003EE29AEF
MSAFSIRAAALSIALFFGTGTAFAGDEAVKGYDRESMQKLFDQMADGSLEGMSPDDQLMTGSVKSAKDKGGKDK